MIGLLRNCQNESKLLLLNVIYDSMTDKEDMK